MIQKTVGKIRQRVNMVNSFRLNGQNSLKLKRALFSCYVLPIFTWLFAIFPLFSEKQRNRLSHFYYTCLKRMYQNLEWTDSFCAFAMSKISLEDRCFRYWERYLNALSETTDGQLILEQANLNLYRTAWLNKQF
jgi:hypothetical protein